MWTRDVQLMWLIVFLDDAEAEVVSLKKKIQTAEDEHSAELTRYEYFYIYKMCPDSGSWYFPLFQLQFF